MDGQWLKTQFLSNPGKTKAGLAAAIGLEPPAISKILNGSRQIKAQEYVAMREYFGLPADGQSTLKRKIASYTVMHGGKDGHDLHDRAAPPSDWIIPASILGARSGGNIGKTRVFQVHDSHMAPEFQKDDHVLVDVSDRKPNPPGTFIISDGFSNMLRHCEYLAKSADSIRISAYDGGFQAHTLQAGDFLIIGRVIAKLQMI